MGRSGISRNKTLRIVVFLTMILSSIGAPRISQVFAFPEGSVRMFMFYAEDCQHCHSVINELLPELKEKYGPIIETRLFEINELENYDLLVKLEKEYGDTDNEIPTIFIDNYVLGSWQEIGENLEDIVIQSISKGGCNWPSLPEGAPINVEDFGPASKTIYLAYFSQPGCKECERAHYLIKNLERKYSNLKVKEYDLSLPENKELEVALCIKYGVPKRRWLVSPAVFVGEDYLLDKKVSGANLENILLEYGVIGSSRPWEKVEAELSQARKVLVGEFWSWGPLTVVVAGLIDGINPCAFAVIIFFVSWLTLIGRKGKTILAVGLTYTFAVFLAYFLIGVGALRFIQALIVFPSISVIIYSLTALFALVLGFFSLYDYFKARKGKWKEIKLQLPKLLKKKIHETTHQFMRSDAKLKSHLAAAFLVGFAVSLFEFPCTGQIYLPTLVFVSQIPGLKTNALSYLILYNLMFILPLGIILGFTYWGTQAPRFVQILEKNTGLVKILTALFFFGLAGYLIYAVIYPSNYVNFF